MYYELLCCGLTCILLTTRNNRFFQLSFTTVYFQLHLGLSNGVFLHVFRIFYPCFYLCVQCMSPYFKVVLLFEFVVS